MVTNWIWQQKDWPRFHWQKEQILPRLRLVQRNLGLLPGIRGSE